MANDQIEALSFSIDINTSKAVTAIDKLSSSLEQFESAANAFQSSGVGKAITEMGQAVAAMDTSKINSFGAALKRMSEKIGGSQTAMFKAANGLRSLANSIPSEEAIGRVERLGAAFKALKGMKASRAASVMEAAANAAPKEEPADSIWTDDSHWKDSAWDNLEVSDAFSHIGETAAEASSSIGSISNALFSLANALGIPQKLNAVLKDVGVGALHAAKNMAQLPMIMGARFASQVKNVTSALRGLVRQFARIVVIKAIRALISMVTKSFQEGVKALYEYSSAMDGVFAHSMDSLATSANYLTNSLAAMASPIYNALAPALDYLVDKIVTVMNWINMLFAALGGAATTTIAKKVPTTFGDAAKAIGNTGGAAKGAAKELKRYILAFDEINALGSQNDRGGSGGGGGGAGGAGGLGNVAFEDVPIANSIKDIADTIMGFIGESKWQDLGTFLGEKFNEAVGMVPWGDLGAKLGNGLKAVIDTSYYFLKEADFLTLGANLGEFVSNAINAVNWENLGRLLVRQMTWLWDMAIGFFMNLDAGGVGTGISNFILGVYHEITEWIQSYEWTEVGLVLGQKIGKLFASIDWPEIAVSIFNFLGEALMGALEFGMSLLIGVFDGFFTTLFESDRFKNSIFGKVADVFGGAFSKENLESGINGSGTPEADVKVNIAELNIHDELKELDGFTIVVDKVKIKKIPNASEIAPAVGETINNLLSGLGIGNTQGKQKQQPTTTGSNLLTAPRANYNGNTRQTASVIGSWQALYQKMVEKGTAAGLTKGAQKASATPFEKLITAVFDPSYIQAETAFHEFTDDKAVKLVDAVYGSGFRPIALDYRGLASNTATKTADALRTVAFNTMYGQYSGTKDKSATLTAYGDTTKSFTTTRDNMNNAPKSKEATYTLKGYMNQSFKDAVNAIKNAVNGTVTNITFGRKNAMGGVYKNGSWSNIPQYASGGGIHGSMFIAGESGAELVGHINGATEVLNKSQLAATMLSSITAGMMQFVPALSTIDSHIVGAAYMNAESNAVMAQMLETLAQQNQTLSEQNGLLEELLEKDTNVEVTTASLTAALQRRNQRDGRPVVPVG